MSASQFRKGGQSRLSVSVSTGPGWDAPIGRRSGLPGRDRLLGRPPAPGRAAASALAAAVALQAHEVAEPDPAGGETRPRHLRVVRPDERSPAQRRRRVRALVLVSAVVVTAVVFGLVGLHVMLAQNQFRLDRLNAQAAAEQSRYERLRLQVDQLESPQRIVATAEQKLGMIQPPSITYLTPSAPPTTAPPATAVGSGAPTVSGTAGTTTATPSDPEPAATVPPPAGASAWSTIKPLLVPNQ